MGAYRPAQRLLYSALAAAFLIAAWGSGLDRMSAASPALERLVPGPFRAQADLSASAIALARGDAPRALERADDAVRRDPASAEASALLGMARSLAGDARGADAAFRVSAQRGWRDRMTQIYWLDQAIRSGDVERAALRADALLRADPDFEAADRLIEPLELTAEGRTALARRLGERPDWTEAYFRQRAEVDPALLQRRAQVALAAVEQGHPPGCDALGPYSAMLIENGMRRDAERLWRAACGNAAGDTPGPGALVDGGFEQLARQDRQGPFGWNKFATGDVAVALVELAQGNHAVQARSSASVTRLLLSQAIDLPPGIWRVKANSSAKPGRLAVSLDCAGRPLRPARVDGDIAGAGQVLTVGACERAVLGLWLRPGAEDVTIDDLSIEKIQ